MICCLPILLQCHLCLLQVVFTNDKTGEYQWYELQYKFIKGGTIETIELTTPVRQSAFKKIKLENTTKQATTFNVQNSIPEILMPNTFSVPPQSTVRASLFENFQLKSCPCFFNVYN